MLANWITLSRFPLLPIALLLLALGTPGVRLAGAALLLAGLLLDTVDGVVARRTGQTSLFGSVIDIAADRAYELVLWLCLAWAGMVPFLIPLIVIVRTTLTDAFRSIGVVQGTAPFAQHRTALGRFLVGSTWMRTGYAVSKTVTFAGFALVQAFLAFPPQSRLAGTVLSAAPLFRVAAWVAVAFCLLRGLPVVIHAVKYHWPARAAVSR